MAGSRIAGMHAGPSVVEFEYTGTSGAEDGEAGAGLSTGGGAGFLAAGVLISFKHKSQQMTEILSSATSDSTWQCPDDFGCF